MVILIKGEDLTEEQIEMLTFQGAHNGMSDKKVWLRCHSFYFEDGKPCSKDSGFFYPVCHSLEFLPY